MSASLFAPIEVGEPRPSEPHRRRPDVPVLGRRRLGDRLAPPALDDAGDERRRHGHRRDDRRRAPRPDQPRLPRPLLRPQRGGGAARARRRAAGRGAGREVRRPARPCRPQGVVPAALGGRRAARGRTRIPWQTVSASALPYADGWHTPHALDEAEIEALIVRFAAVGRAGAARRLRLHRAAQRARLPLAPVPVAAQQPPRRRLGRVAREPPAAPARDHPADPRRGARADARGAPLGHRLGRGRPHRRRRRRDRRRLPRGGRRLRLLLLGRQLAGAEGADRTPATRSTSPRRCGPAPASSPARSG